ncbi:MAG TPA: Gfo/Idh/MocA family oxidoreductase [Planctomycetota bacterium]|nr:Gfo/Idh/MocA family oxidoreductase [Planctomycetota bacterium]
MDFTRRQFIAGGSALAAAPFLGIHNPHRAYRTALIGSGWWGKNILKEAVEAGKSKVVALCDVDRNALEVAAEQVKGWNGDQPKTYGDYRELLEKEKPEIVIIATPDHWHALISIAAVKAGAHVFVEKPTGHTVHESSAMLKAAKESGKVVQVGLHRRIGPHHVSALKFLKDGGAGQVGMVRLFAHYGGGPEKPSANAAPPEGMNWDMYCGPSQLRPFTRKIHPGGWRQFLDFGNGQLGDWGVHWIDQVLAWTDETAPRRIYSSGGRQIKGAPVLNDKEQTTDAPDHQVAVYEFESFTCTWEHRQFADNTAEKHQIGAYFYGTKGTLHIGWRDGWTFHPANAKEKVLHEDSQLQEPDGHNIKLLWADFLAAIDGGHTPVAGIERAHRSSVLPLLGMLSWRVGRSITWDGAKEQIVGDPDANAMLKRAYRGPWVYPT